MSSAEALLAMRSSGSTRASAAFAGSSDGNGLSVTAIKGRAMKHSTRAVPLLLQYFRIDAIGRCLAVEQREDVVDHDVRHLLAHLDHGAAEMGGSDDVRHLEQRRRDVGLVLEHVEAGAGDLALLQGARERRFVD